MGPTLFSNPEHGYRWGPRPARNAISVHSRTGLSRSSGGFRARARTCRPAHGGVIAGDSRHHGGQGRGRPAGRGRRPTGSTMVEASRRLKFEHETANSHHHRGRVDRACCRQTQKKKGASRASHRKRAAARSTKRGGTTVHS